MEAERPALAVTTTLSNRVLSLFHH
jgi:hypothetical protein